MIGYHLSFHLREEREEREEREKREAADWPTG
jgi:hypothetical protein